MDNDFESMAREITAGITEGTIRTREGRPVRIISWDAKGDYPIVALVDYGFKEAPESYTLDGKYDTRKNVRSSFDLVIDAVGNGE